MDILDMPEIALTMSFDDLEKIVVWRKLKLRRIAEIEARASRLNNAEYSPWTYEAAKAALHDRYFDSVDRPYIALQLIRNIERDGFWPILTDGWVVGDSISVAVQEEILELIKVCNPPPWRDFASTEDAEFFDALPSRVSIYRGSERSRIRGMAWTTDYSVAEGFARGHRGLRPYDPVITTASVAKADILFCATERGESEIVLRPGRVRVLKISPYLSEAA